MAVEVYMKACPVCSKDLIGGRQQWHFVCNGCGYENAGFEPYINDKAAHELVDEKAREIGLRHLRISNFQELLERIKIQKPEGGSLLDVGCAHGWFIEEAQKHFIVQGIEPDRFVFETTQERRLPVRCGFFPNILEDNERFDVIVFNDVIEHVPEIADTVSHCHRHLNDDGLLVLNLPNSKGFFYQIAKLLINVGITKPFERMWQKSLPSPHLHYFNADNLIRLLEKRGFVAISVGCLPTLRLDGLYSRISYTGRYGLVVNLIIYMMVVISLPALKVLPSDIMYVICRKK